MRLALVVNPAAGARADARDLEARLRGAGAQVETFPPDRLEAAAACRPDRLVVAGGDGTVGRAAVVAAHRLDLAVLPAGTGNDFARGMGLPLDLEAACRVAATGTRIAAIDLARLDGRGFLTVASLGLAATAAERARGPKRLLGPIAYVLGALQAGLLMPPVPCRVSCDGRELFSGRAWQVIVANSGRFGGGASVEAADPTDGLLDATVIEAGPRARLVAYAYAMRVGRIASARGVRHARARSIEVVAPEGAAYNVDGEVVRQGTARFSVEPAAVRVVVA